MVGQNAIIVSNHYLWKFDKDIVIFENSLKAFLNQITFRNLQLQLAYRNTKLFS